MSIIPLVTLEDSRMYTNYYTNNKNERDKKAKWKEKKQGKQ